MDKNIPNLKNARSDAEEIANLLTGQYQFDGDCKTLYDGQATRKAIQTALDHFVKHSQEEDSLLIYYSGYGYYRKDLRVGYWVPADAEIGDYGLLISNTTLLDYLPGIPARHVVLMVDCCFSGSLFRFTEFEAGEYSEKSIQKMMAGRSRLGIAAGSIELVADEGLAGNHSPFSSSLLKLLRENKMPYLPARDLFHPLSQMTTYQADQYPVYGILAKSAHDLGSQLVFCRRRDLRSVWEELRQAPKLDGVLSIKKEFAAQLSSSEFRPLKQELRKLEIRLRWQEAHASQDHEVYLHFVRDFHLDSHAPVADALEWLETWAGEISERLHSIDELRDTLTQSRRAEQEAKQALRAAQKEHQEAEEEHKQEITVREESMIRLTNEVEELQVRVNTQTQAQEQLRAELAQARQAGSAAYENAAKQIWEEQFSKTSSMEELDRFLRWFPEGSPAAQARALREKLRSLSLPEMIRIEGGSFVMGSNEDDREKPLHRVRLSSFEIGKYPVTQRQWETVMGQNPSHFDGPELPVENVSWNDVQAFIGKLNEKTGLNYRLPTEAEWEYAAGGGAENRTKWAGTSNENQLGDYAWHSANSGGQTHPVGQKKPNAMGLYDMSGNVWEWCSDWYGNYPSEPQTNPTGPATGANRVLRGGSWLNGPVACRVARRRSYGPADRAVALGFRLARQF